ncbi:DUF1801 domain-containing protein [Microbacteriaceae bacterium VKM Ac-2855]|nr:DUF1801 domain-containing protein [Microbacteriaceae bacterium VKM Ac-2855]
MAPGSNTPKNTPKTTPKTVPTAADVELHLAGLPLARQAECRILIAEMSAISGEAPVLWGPSIIGFGSYHYRYASGREGDAPLLSFASRGTTLSLYLADGVAAHEVELDRLGPHSVGKGCLYLKRLADIDIAVLRGILARSRDTVRALH